MRREHGQENEEDGDLTRRSIVLLVIVGLVLIALGLRFWIAGREQGGGDLKDLGELFDIFPTEDRLVLEPATFADLPGWGEDAVEEAVPAFLRSCRRIAALPDDGPRRRRALRRSRPRTGSPPAPRPSRLPPGQPPGGAALLRGPLPALRRPQQQEPPGALHRLLRAPPPRQPKARRQVHRAPLHPAARAGDGGPGTLPRRPQGQADRRQGRGRRPRPLSGPQGDRRRSPRRPQARSSSGWTIRSTPSSSTSRARAASSSPKGARCGSATRLRTATPTPPSAAS